MVVDSDYTIVGGSGCVSSLPSCETATIDGRLWVTHHFIYNFFNSMTSCTLEFRSLTTTLCKSSPATTWSKNSWKLLFLFVLLFLFFFFFVLPPLWTPLLPLQPPCPSTALLLAVVTPVKRDEVSSELLDVELVLLFVILVQLFYTEKSWMVMFLTQKLVWTWSLINWYLDQYVCAVDFYWSWNSSFPTTCLLLSLIK